MIVEAGRLEGEKVQLSLIDFAAYLVNSFTINLYVVDIDDAALMSIGGSGNISKQPPKYKLALCAWITCCTIILLISFS